MNNDKKPSIRFKGFSKEWEQRKFNILADTKRGLTYKTTDIEKDGIRVLRSSNISGDNFIYGEDDVFVNKNAVNIDFVKNDDILITSANGSTRLVGKHALIKELPINSAVHGGFMLLASPKENPEFLNASMSSSWYCKFIDLYVAGGNGAIGNLNKSDLDNQEVYIPKSLEQKKIGLLFNRLDNLITLHKCKYDKLVNIKKLLLEKMFPKNDNNIPEIRFNGFNEAWKKYKLKELGVILTGNTPSTTIKEYYSNDGIQWVTPTDITCNVILNTERKLSKEGAKVGRIVPANTILVTCIASIGKNAIVTEKSAFNQQINSLTPYFERHNPYFLLADSVHWSNIMKKAAGGQTFQIVNKTEFSEIETNVPKYKEEEKIGLLFNRLDKLITLQQNKLEKFKNLKKSLLNKMFI